TPARPGEVRDFIMFKARARHPLVDQQKVRKLGLLVGEIFEHPVLRRKSQKVAAQVRNGKLRESTERIFEVSERSAGNPAKEIDGHIVEARFENVVQSSESGRAVMHASQQLEMVIAKRLNAHTDAVYAKRSVRLHSIQRDGRGICFHC